MKIGEIIRGRDLGYRSNGNNKYIWLACSDCGKERWIMLARIKNRIPPKCGSCASRDRVAMRDNLRGTNNPQWLGGRHKLPNGYIEIWIDPNNPYHKMVPKRGKHNNNFILEHRFIMAQYLKRCLYSWEIIHHINGIKDDNRIENLFLVDEAIHEHRTFEKQLQKEIKLLKWQVKILTMRLNQAGIDFQIPMYVPEELYKT